MSAGNATTAPLKRKLYKSIKSPAKQLNSSYVTFLYAQLEISPLKKVILWGKFQLLRQSMSPQNLMH